MLITSICELEKVREECESLVIEKAAIYSMADLVPLPGVGIAANIGMLMNLIPEINKRFGLSEEQVENLDVHSKILFYQIAQKIGSAFVGKIITKQVILQVLTKMAARVVVQNFLKWIPLIGQIAAGAINFFLMKYVGNVHIDDCYVIVNKLLQHQLPKSRPSTTDTNSKCKPEEIISILKILQELLDNGIIDEKEFMKKRAEILANL